MSGVSRDQGLRRISRITRWIGVAGIAAAGLFAAIAAKAQPGRSAVVTPADTGSTTVGTGPTTSPSTAVPASGDQTGDGLVAPAQAPRAAKAPPAVVSGGS